MFKKNNISQLKQAEMLYGRGRLTESEALARHVVEVNPACADAYHLLGQISLRKGLLEEASEYIGAAIRKNPKRGVYLLSLGMVFRQKGDFSKAISSFEKAIEVSPESTAAHNSMGVLLMHQGQLPESLACFQRVLDIDSRNVEALYNRASVFQMQKKFDLALLDVDAALAINSSSPNVHNLRGIVLMGLDRLSDARDAFLLAIRFHGQYAEAFYNLGLTLMGLDRLEEAVSAFEKTIQLRPDLADAYNDLGLALRNVGCMEEARRVTERAIEINPEFAKAHFNYAILLLLQGDYINGWKEFEWRWRADEFSSPKNEFDMPLWDGASLQGKSIFLHAEQGFGDTIQFSRYVSVVAKSGGKVVLGCQKALKTLLSTLPGVDQVIAHDERIPRCDVYAPLMSLPCILKSTIETIPADVPYLLSSELPEEIRKEFTPGRNNKRVGIVWGGNPDQKSDKGRSIPLSYLRPLMDISGIDWVSLQVGRYASDLKESDGFERVLDVGPYLSDFSVTASVIERLDLVISVDTAVAHLAGALAAPVWVLQAFKPDWRYLPGDGGSLWYPTMRVFRQAIRSDWVSVISNVCEALKYWQLRGGPGE